MGRMAYRLYRNPFFLFGLGALLHFVVVHRFPWTTPREWKKAWQSVRLTNLALVGIILAMAVTTGTGPINFEDEEFLKAAVRLLVLANHSEGPTTVSTFDNLEMAGRLGPALYGVEEVERALLREGAIYPVFSR